MTRKKKWPEQAEWARLDTLGYLAEIRRLAETISRVNQEGDRLAVADRTFTIHRLAAESTIKLKECKDWA